MVCCESDVLRPLTVYDGVIIQQCVAEQDLQLGRTKEPPSKRKIIRASSHLGMFCSLDMVAPESRTFSVNHKGWNT